MSIKKTLATNTKARRDYAVADTFEAGIKLSGPEVKSCKKGQLKLVDSYAIVRAGASLWLIGCYIAPYKPATGSQTDYHPARARALLLHKKQAATLIGKLKQKGYSLVPLSLYSKAGIIKVELALVRGKKQYEKRDAIKKRDIEREIGRRLRR